MPVDPRTPVLIGYGQVNHRDEIDPDKPLRRTGRPDGRRGPAGRRCPGDRGRRLHPRGATCCRRTTAIPGCCSASGSAPTDFTTLYSPVGGNVPQSLVNQACLDIQQGRAGVVLLAGAETWRTRTRLRAKGGKLGWTDQDESVPMAEVSGDDVPMAGDAEIRIKLDRPAYVYPLFEQALRIANGESVEDHASASASCGRASTPSRSTIRTPGSANRSTAEEIRRPARRTG